MDQNRIVHSIRCSDVVERERVFQVIGEPGRLALVAPPGEVAYLSPRQYEQLRMALLDVLPVAWKEAPA